MFILHNYRTPQPATARTLLLPFQQPFSLLAAGSSDSCSSPLKDEIPDGAKKKKHPYVGNRRVDYADRLKFTVLEFWVDRLNCIFSSPLIGPPILHLPNRPGCRGLRSRPWLLPGRFSYFQACTPRSLLPEDTDVLCLFAGQKQLCHSKHRYETGRLTQRMVAMEPAHLGPIDIAGHPRDDGFLGHLRQRRKGRV